MQPEDDIKSERHTILPEHREAIMRLFAFWRESGHPFWVVKWRGWTAADDKAFAAYEPEVE